MTNMTRINNKRGFTLIELLVVVSIIGLLASIVLASLSDAKNKAVNTAINNMVYQYKLALELYSANNNGAYPLTNDGVFYCLGTYSDDCGLSTGPGTVNPSLNTALSTYINNFPPVSPSPFVYGSSGDTVLGATYRCLASSPCSRALIIWWLKGVDQKCLFDAVSANAPASTPTVTRCTWTLNSA